MWNVIGHERAIAELETAMRSGRLPHSLLFTGREGTGKTTLALELAKALNCTGDSPPARTVSTAGK
jgi:DNA polymerase-3 subunit delta'